MTGGFRTARSSSAMSRCSTAGRSATRGSSGRRTAAQRGPGQRSAVSVQLHGQHPDMAWLIGPDGILDPTRWFIVIPDMFSNGLSSGRAETPDYPAAGDVAGQCAGAAPAAGELFGIERLAAVYGFSMGAQQAYHWAALFPDGWSGPSYVRQRADRRAQQGVPVEPAAHAGGGAGAPRRWPVLGRAARRPARLRPYLRGLGAEPGLLPGGAAPRRALGAPDLDTFLRTRLGGPYHAAPGREPLRTVR